MRIRAFIADRRGSAALAPVFIILAVISLVTVVAALLFTQSVSEHTSAQQASGAAARSAVQAMTSELNMTTLDAVTAQLAAAGNAGYVPAAWIPAGGQSMHVTAVTSPATDTIHVTFTIDIDREHTERTFTVEYRNVGGDPATWAPARTIPEAQ